MAKAAKGFLTEDGFFFETKEEAALHETAKRLAIAVMEQGLSAYKVIGIVNANISQVRDYIAARAKIELGRDEVIVEAAVASIGERDFESGQDDVEAELLQPPGEYLDVPDFRSSELAEAMAGEGEGDGTGSGERDARSVRGGEDMAVDTYPKIAKTRISDRK